MNKIKQTLEQSHVLIIYLFAYINFICDNNLDAHCINTFTSILIFYFFSVHGGQERNE